MPPSSPDRRSVLQGLAASAAWSSTAIAAEPDEEVGFVALGDWGQRGKRSQRQVADAMGLAAMDMASRFVMAAGDNFYPGGVMSVEDSHWRESFEDIYTAPALQTPWYAALGNHDYRGRVQAQIDYTALSPRWRMPSRFFRIGGETLGTRLLDIFVIDTAPMVDGGNYDEMLQQVARGHIERHDDADQIAWLKSALSRSTAPWKIVMGHHPVYSGGHGDSPQLVDQIAPLLKAHGVQVYLNGHDHSLQHIHRAGVDYICTGSGAEAGDRAVAVEGTQFYLSRPGFAAFRLKAEALDLDFRDLEGRTVYSARLPRERQTRA